MARKISGKTPKAYFRSGIPVAERPWYALTASQKELRLDTVTWSEGHDIFLHELLEHPVKRVRSCASTTNQENMKLMIRAWKQGLDLAQVPLGTLSGTPPEDWAALPRAPLSYETEPKTKAELQAEARATVKKAGAKAAPAKAPKPASEPKSGPITSPALGGTFSSLDRLLDAVVEKALEPAGRKFKERKPPAWATAPEPMPWGDDTTGSNAQTAHKDLSKPSQQAGPGTSASNGEIPHKDMSEPSQRADPGAAGDSPSNGQTAHKNAPRPSDRPDPDAGGGHVLNARSDPKFDARRRAKGAAMNARYSSTSQSEKSNEGTETEVATPDPDQRPETSRDSAVDLAEIELIREKLVVNGKVRLDLEALAVYLMCPSYFAIATGLDPEPWQSRFLDSYAQRLGCLASRQCGKSIITARKACCFAMTNPGTTVLVLAPTLRQSSELLLKVGGVTQIAGLKIASWSQFQIVLADKQPGAASRIVCLPGSNEDAGASTRGYAADMLILEEAAFLNDAVISSVLPSIAARPKAQLIGISSAGIIGTYFHSVMTSPQSRWQKMIVPAAESGRFTRQQLEELKLTLGARYAVEMECQWGSVGDSIYTEDVMTAAFGTDFTDPAVAPELDPEAAFGHLNLEEIFAAQPFPQRQGA